MAGIIEDKVAQASRRAALGLSAGLFITVGLAFATVAIWIILAATLSVLHAAAIIALIYLGVGLILLGMTLSSPKHSAHYAAVKEPEHAKVGTAPPLVEAFLFGLQAGSDASKARKN